MGRAFLVVAMLGIAGSAFGQDDLSRSMCYYTDQPGIVRRVPLPGGAVVELRRTTGEDLDVGDCQLQVFDAAEVPVLLRGGFGARVMPATGNDLDGDGVVDAVLSVDEGGGNRCCWNTIVVTLSAPPRVRAEVPEPLGWRFDPARKRFVAEEVLAFYQLGPDMASSPVAIRFHRLGAAGFEDVTPDYCDDLLDPQGRGGFSRDDDRGLLTPARLAAARAGTGDAFERQQTGLAAIGLALQFHVCGRPGGADTLLTEAFPPADVSAVRQRVADAVAALRPK